MTSESNIGATAGTLGASTSHVGGLSDDVLILIFQWSMVDHPHSSPSFPAISQVCCRWRNLALGSGSLWRRILLTDQKSLALARASFTRSKQSLLEVTVRAQGYGKLGDETIAITKVLDDILAQHAAHRIESLVLHAPEYRSLPAALLDAFIKLAILPKARTLRRFKLSNDLGIIDVEMAKEGLGPLPPSSEVVQLPTTFDLANQTLVVPASQTHPQMVHFLWNTFSNLKKLMIWDQRGVSPKIKHAHLYTILATSPRLEEMMLQGRTTILLSPGHHEAGAEAVIQMRCLQKLRLDDVNVGVLEWLLNTLQTPHLKSLHIDQTFEPLGCFIALPAVRAGLAKFLASNHPNNQPFLELSLSSAYHDLEISNPLEFLSPLGALKTLHLTSFSWVEGHHVFTPLVGTTICIQKLHCRLCYISWKDLYTFVTRQARPPSAILMEDCALAMEAEEENALGESVPIDTLVSLLKERVNSVEFVESYVVSPHNM